MSEKQPDVRDNYAGRNRLGKSATTYVLKDGLYYPQLGAIMSDPKDDVPVVPRKSLIEQLNIPLGVKVALLVLGALCAVPPMLLSAGIAVPPALVAVASALAAILASLGVASGGLEKPKE